MTFRDLGLAASIAVVGCGNRNERFDVIVAAQRPDRIAAVAALDPADRVDLARYVMVRFHPPRTWIVDDVAGSGPDIIPAVTDRLQQVDHPVEGMLVVHLATAVLCLQRTGVDEAFVAALRHAVEELESGIPEKDAAERALAGDCPPNRSNRGL